MDLLVDPLTGQLAGSLTEVASLQVDWLRRRSPLLTTVGSSNDHTFRRSVATLMDTAGLSARAASDQLGHAQTSTTMNQYFGRKLRSTGAAAVLG